MSVRAFDLVGVSGVECRLRNIEHRLVHDSGAARMSRIVSSGSSQGRCIRSLWRPTLGGGLTRPSGTSCSPSGSSQPRYGSVRLSLDLADGHVICGGPDLLIQHAARHLLPDKSGCRVVAWCLASCSSWTYLPTPCHLKSGGYRHNFVPRRGLGRRSMMWLSSGTASPWRATGSADHGEREAVPLGHELAIRALPDLDVDDDASILAFTAQHGFLDTFRGISSRLDRWVVGPELVGSALTSATAMHMEASGARVVHRPEAPRGVGIYVYTHEAREVLRVARSLARHLVAHLLGEDVASAWEGTLWRVAGENVPEEEQAWISFANYLTAGLRTFAARVEFTAVRPDGDDAYLGAPRADLFTGLCHHLFNCSWKTRR